MATRLYFQAGQAPTVSPAFNSAGAWASTSGAVRRRLLTTKAAATETLSGVLTGAINDNRLAVQLVSPPLAGAQTVSGTYSIVTRGRELLAEDNVNKRWRALTVVSKDGSTVRGTLVATAATASTTELTTSLAGQSHAAAGGLTSVNAQDGDRIVIELGYGASVAGTTPNWEMALGGNGTDHANANGDTTGTVPWAELSANLVFQTEVALTESAGASDELTTARSLSVSDTAAAADVAAISATIPAADSATGVDGLAAAVQAQPADTATAGDALTLSATATLTDVPAGSDALTAAVAAPITDTAIAADALARTVAAPLTDSAAATDALAAGAAISAADTATGADALAAAATGQLPDNAAAVDALAMASTGQLPDNATAADQLLVTTAVALADSAGAAPAVTVTRSLPGAAPGGLTSTIAPHSRQRATVAANSAARATVRAAAGYRSTTAPPVDVEGRSR